jgi:hypothetical protein
MPNGSQSSSTIPDHRDYQESVFSGHRRLVEWILQNNGYLHPNVEIAYSPAKGYHMIVAAGKTITPQTRITSCPMTCVLSILNVLNIEPFSNHGVKFPQEFLRNNVSRPELLQAFFLMEHALLGDRSFWAPYIQTLPSVEDINELQFESEEDQQWLSRTNLAVGRAQLMDKWKGFYEKGLKELKIMNWQNAINDKLTWYV